MTWEEFINAHETANIKHFKKLSDLVMELQHALLAHLILCVICGEPILPYVMGVLQLFLSHLRPAGGIFIASLSHLCRIFVVSLSYLCRIFVVSLSYLCRIFVISLSYLCRIFDSIFVWGHLSPEPVARLALAHLVGPFLALAEVTMKNAGPEHF